MREVARSWTTGSDGATETRDLSGTRVLIVIGPLVLGGAERQAMLLATLLRDDWAADVEVWATYEGSDQLVPYLEASGIRWRMVHAPIVGAKGTARFRLKQLKRYWTFLGSLRQSGADVVLPFMSLPSVVVSLLWRFTRIRSCIWNMRFDGTDIDGSGIFTIARLAARTPTAFVSNSERGAAYLRDRLRVDPRRSHVIYNGVCLPKPEKSRAEWRSELGAHDEDIVVCMVANLHPPKDQASLIRAWVHVCEHVGAQRQAILVLAGRFVSSHDELLQLAATLGVGHAVRLPGAVRDVSGLLGAVDIGAFSSRHEGMPNGLLECMACALPVVATDLPSTREALGPDSGSFLVAVGDAEAFADRIVELIDDAALRTEVGRRNRERIDVHFSPATMARRFAEVIREGLS